MSSSPYVDADTHAAMDCVFCTVIADGDELIYSDDRVAAILDIRPLFPGHLLVMPVDHVVTLDQLPVDQVQPLFAVVQRASAAMATVLGAEGAFVANNNIVSQSVHHLHVHVVPRSKGDGLRGFFWPRVGYADEGHKREVGAALSRALGVDAPGREQRA